MFHRTISLLGSPVGVVRSSTGLSSLPSAMALLPGILKASNRPKNSHVKSICTLQFSKLLAPENPVGNVHRLSVEVTSIDGEVCPRWGQLHPLGSLKSLGMNRVWHYVNTFLCWLIIFMIVKKPEELCGRDRCLSSESTLRGDERQTPLVKSALDKIDVKLPQK